MDSSKTVTIGDVEIEIGRLTYAGQMERNALVAHFQPPYDENGTPEYKERYVAIYRFLCAPGQTRKVKGVKVELPHSSDSPADFERKLAQYLELDYEVVEEWAGAIDDISRPRVPKSQLPAAMLTDEERKDPK